MPYFFGECLRVRGFLIANGGSRRIELERVPAHTHLIALRKALEGGIEAALADEAPQGHAMSDHTSTRSESMAALYAPFAGLRPPPSPG